MGQRIALWAAGLVVCAAGGAAADVVTDWNNVWLDTIRATGGGPCPISRAGAMLHVAIFDAANSIDPTYEPYLGFVPVKQPADQTAAVAVAAHDVLVHVYPSRQVIFDQALKNSLAVVPDGPAKTNGMAVGSAAAGDCLANRARDNSDDNSPYRFGNRPGDYQLTDGFTAPHGPNWWKCSTWVINQSRYFRPEAPLGYQSMPQLLRSPEYAAQFNEVKSLGARNSATRTADQTEIAWFWANDRDGTYKPPGHLNYATQVISEQEGLTVLENARLFALVNLALADGVIVTWEAKYHTNIDFWRPVTGIRQAATDGNPATAPDAGWVQLLEFTPPFPSYTSGHSCMGGTWAGVLRSFFGTDEVAFTIGTDEPIVQNVTRNFHSFTQAGFEDAVSRIYLGVHWRMDCEASYNAGLKIGDFVAHSVLRPLE
jgi:membrane-associated phospholipid phosphatase